MPARTVIPLHCFVRIDDVDDFLALGWMPLDTLDATPHGAWSVDLGWPCGCVPVEPTARMARRAEREGI